MRWIGHFGNATEGVPSSGKSPRRVFLTHGEEAGGPASLAAEIPKSLAFRLTSRIIRKWSNWRESKSASNAFRRATLAKSLGLGHVGPQVALLTRGWLGYSNLVAVTLRPALD